MSRTKRVALSAVRVWAYSFLGALIASGVFDTPGADDLDLLAKAAYAAIPAGLAVVVNALEPETSPVRPQ